MAHGRTVVRRAVRDLLRGKTDAKDRVHMTRIEPYREKDLPAISVFTMGEVVEKPDTAPRMLEREIDLVIVGYVNASGSSKVPVDEAMDALALQIEAAMDADPQLGGAAADCYLVGTDPDLKDEGELLLGVVALSYAVAYQTHTPDSTDDLDDFLTADVKHNVGDELDENDAHDEVVVQEATP